MSIYVRKNIETLKPYVPGKPIEEVKRELGLKKVIKLASNENCLGPSPKAISAVKSALADVNRYPDASSFYLKKRLASFLGKKEENLIIGNGSDEVIVIAIRTFLGEGDEAIIAEPTFLIYEIALQIQGVKVIPVGLRPGFKYDLKAMKSAITPKTKMVFIANPDNPTGTYVTKGELDEFLDGLEGVIVYLDEAYFEFANFNRKDYPNGLDYLARPNLIVGRSFSKAYGLAGLRVGYGISNTRFINYMERVRDPFNVDILAQAAAIAALSDKAFLERTLRHIEKEKLLLYKAFQRMKLDYVPSATNFILIDVKKGCVEVSKALLRKGVIVRDMKAWGLDTCIRVTIGTMEENSKFIKMLEDIL